MKAVQQPRKNGWGLRFYLKSNPMICKAYRVLGYPASPGGEPGSNLQKTP